VTLSLPTRASVIRTRHTTSSPAPVQPSDIGMPSKFSAWRPGQWECVDRVLGSEKRFVVLCLPTGAGKTGVALAACLINGGRSVVLTATKGLQDQIVTEMREMVADVRGQSNYLCPIADKLGVPRSTTVAEAPCQCGYPCALKRGVGGCGYYDAYRHAQQSDIVVGNYQMWLYDRDKDSANGDLQYGWIPDGTGVTQAEQLRAKQKVRMLVADEVHGADGQLSMYLGVDLTRKSCLGMHMEWPDSGMTVDDWREWAREWTAPITVRIKDAEERIRSGYRSWSKDLKSLRDMARNLDKLAGMKAEDGWVLSEQDVKDRSMTSVRFEPLHPARYAETVLWRGTEKVVLVSATVRPKTLEMLGIDMAQVEFIEGESTFPIERRPIVYYPTVRMSYRTEQDDREMKWLLGRLDDVIEQGLEWKQIVHAVSYGRARFVFDNSRWHRYMITHNTFDRATKIEEFRRSEAPRILVSPSVDTGYDFAHDEARIQHILKIPFQSVSDALVKARQQEDKEYGLYIAVQTLQQMTGRIMRAENDWGLTVVYDEQLGWVLGKGRKFFCRWWMEALRTEKGKLSVREMMGKVMDEEIQSAPVGPIENGNGTGDHGADSASGGTGRGVQGTTMPGIADPDRPPQPPCVQVVHCKRHPFDIYIGRGSMLGNDWTHLPLAQTKAKYQVGSRHEAIVCWEEWAWERMQTDLVFRKVILKCEGKRLGCYCVPEECHGEAIGRLIVRWKAQSNGHNQSLAQNRTWGQLFS